MPLSEGLQKAVEAGRDANLGAALEVIGLTEVIHLLSDKSSFMSRDLDDGELGALATDIRRVRDESTRADLRCGGYADFAAGASALPVLRAVIYTARHVFTSAFSPPLSSAPSAPPAPAEDPFKPLPPKEVESWWLAGERTTCGYSCTLPKHRLADSIMSRMVRANKAGEIWLPPIDKHFTYREASSNHVVTTLLKGSGGPISTESELQIQVVQGGQSAERHDPVKLVADYTDLIVHRSAAIIACYSTPGAVAAYRASPRFNNLRLHAAVDAGNEMLICPKLVAMLERSLRAATRHGLSTSEVLLMDQRVIAAIADRAAMVPVDGNTAIEYVCEQRESLFRSSPQPSSVLNLDQLGQSAIGPHDSASQVGKSSTLSDARSAQDSKLIARLQSERDKAYNDLKRQRTARGSEQSSTSNSVVYGGRSGRAGGGDQRGPHICKSYNLPDGCYRNVCKFRHCCDKDVRGRPCGDSRHNACTH